MAQKFYAVRRGKTPGVYRTWAECKAQVDGYSCASYKSFATAEEAMAFIAGNPEETAADAEEDGVIAYVDGSYHSGTGEFSYGMVVLRDGKEYYFCDKGNDPELASMRNVAGEIKGAEAAMRYALEQNCTSITIVHDYEGIAKWCLGEWKTGKEGTRAYKAYYDSVKDRVAIHFRKVRGHSNDKYNDMADSLAKKALGIE